MKAKKTPTKKEIAKELRSLECTRIHRIAARCGINAQKACEVYSWLECNSPSERIAIKACEIVRRRSLNRNIIKSKCESLKTDIFYWINEAKRDAKRGRDGYSKMFILGNNNIYWASPVYQHADYNKSRSMPINEKNIERMNVINRYLAKHGIN